jgi:hypothetical protein
LECGETKRFENFKYLEPGVVGEDDRKRRRRIGNGLLQEDNWAKPLRILDKKGALAREDEVKEQDDDEFATLAHSNACLNEHKRNWYERNHAAATVPGIDWFPPTHGAIRAIDYQVNGPQALGFNQSPFFLLSTFERKKSTINLRADHIRQIVQCSQRWLWQQAALR